jgi:hypothetical protein
MNDNKELTEIEQNCLQLFWDIGFPEEPKIKMQIRSAKLRREYTSYYRLLEFEVNPIIPPIPSILTVPMEVIVEHKKNINPKYYSGKLTWNVYRKERPFVVPLDPYDEGQSPTCFLLHTFNGYVSELEIYNLDSSKLDIVDLCIGKRTYILNY